MSNEIAKHTTNNRVNFPNYSRQKKGVQNRLAHAKRRTTTHYQNRTVEVVEELTMVDFNSDGFIVDLGKSINNERRNENVKPMHTGRKSNKQKSYR